MNRHQLSRSVTYHGNTLVDHLVYERQNFERSQICSPDREQIRNRGEIRDREFTNSIQRFIAKKADLLFSNEDENPDRTLRTHQTYDPGDDYYSILPPLETFMGIPPDDCKIHFYDSLEKKDVVVASVTSILDAGMVVTLLSLDSTKARDIDHLKITAFCPCKELPRHYNPANPIEAFQVNDKIRGIVLNVNRENKKILISMLDKHMDGENTPNIKLGLITDEDVPVHYRRKVYYQGLTYEELLHTVIGFNNSGSIPYLLQSLNHPVDTGSITRSLHNYSLPETEYAEGLRAVQSRKIANKNVAEGISYFKRNQHIEAMQMFNKALQIDSGNVEALVARGALYANNESYKRAIEDFEEAFAANPRHQNACKYLCQTLVAQGKILEEQRLLSEAESYYKRALHIDPHYEEAGRYLHYISYSNKSNSGNKHVGGAGLECPTNVENSPHSSMEGFDRTLSQKKKKGQKNDPFFKRIVATERIPLFRKDMKYQDGSASDASSTASSRQRKSWSRSSVDHDSNVSQQSCSKMKQSRYMETCDPLPPDTHAPVLRGNHRDIHSYQSPPKDYKSEPSSDRRPSKSTVGSSCWNTMNDAKRMSSKSPSYAESLPSMNPYDNNSSAYKMTGQTIADRNRAKGKSQSREYKEIYINRESSERPGPYEGVADPKSRKIDVSEFSKGQTGHETASSTYSHPQIPTSYKYRRPSPRNMSETSHDQRSDYEISKMQSSDYSTKSKKALLPGQFNTERKEKQPSKDLYSKRDIQKVMTENEALPKDLDYQFDFKSQSHRKLDRKHSSREVTREECEPPRKRSRKYSPSVDITTETSDNLKYQKCKLPDIIESTRNVIGAESLTKVETSRKHSGNKHCLNSSSQLDPNATGSKSTDKDPTQKTGTKGKHRKRRSRSSDSSSSSSSTSSSSTSSSSSSSSTSSSSSSSSSGLGYRYSKGEADPDTKSRKKRHSYSESGELRTKRDRHVSKTKRHPDYKSKSRDSKSEYSPQTIQSDKTGDLYKTSRERQEVINKTLSKEMLIEKFQPTKEQHFSSLKGKIEEPLMELNYTEKGRKTNMDTTVDRKEHLRETDVKLSYSDVSKSSIIKPDRTRAFADELQKSTKNFIPSRLTEKETEIADSEDKLSECKKSDIFQANLPEGTSSRLSPESRPSPSSSCANYDLDVKNVCDSSAVAKNLKVIVAGPSSPPPLPCLNPPPLPPLPPLSPPPPEGIEAPDQVKHGNCGDNTEQVVNDDKKSVCPKEKEENLQESGQVNSTEKKHKNTDNNCRNKEKTSVQSTETLDELESFLSKLKENKKKQMITEGKNQKWKKL